MARVTGMSENDRRVLQENLVNIQSNLSQGNIDKICDTLFAKKILDRSSVQQIRSVKSPFRMVDILLTHLVTCGSTAFDVFCNVLDEVNRELADHLRSQQARSSTPAEPMTVKTSDNTNIKLPSSAEVIGEELDSIYPDLDIHKVAITAEYTLKTDNLIYDMRKKPHGYMLIFNQETFSRSLNADARNGSGEDADKLENLFRGLDYKVDRCNDYTASEIKKKINEYSKSVDHRNFDSFICAFLSHGEHDYIYAKDERISLQNIFAKFRGDQCPTLAGKPKVFFIQACRGENFDNGADTVDSKSDIEKEDVPDSTGSTLPSEGDFLLAYATVPGYFAWRNSAGSWFIQTVVNVIQQYHQHMDLMRMLTRVNCYVAQKESQTRDKKKRGKKQIPSIVSRLRRDLYFSIEAARRSGACSSDYSDK